MLHKQAIEGFIDNSIQRQAISSLQKHCHHNLEATLGMAGNTIKIKQQK